MAEHGVSTGEQPPVALIDDLIGNRDGSTSRINIAALAALLRSIMGPHYTTRAALFADLLWPAGAVALVLADPTAGYNGNYIKSGASGSGAWTRTGDLAATAVRDRSLHTGTQALTTVDGLVAALLEKAGITHEHFFWHIFGLAEALDDHALAIGQVALAVDAAVLLEETRAKIVEALIGSCQRPGDLASAYAPELTGAVTATTPYLPASVVVDADLGAAIRLTTATHVAARAPVPIEPGRVYQARYAAKRLTNPTDPLGDAIQIGARWLTESLAGVAGGSGNRVIETIPLEVDPGAEFGGVQRRAVTLSIDVAGVDYTIPAAARYGRAWLRTYGTDHDTLAGRAGLLDITEAWFAQRDASLAAAALLAETAARQATLGKAGVIALANVAGTADAITADRAAGLTDVAIGTGTLLQLVPASATTITAPTLTVAGVTRTIRRRDGAALVAGDVQAGVAVILRVVDGATLRLITSLRDYTPEAAVALAAVPGHIAAGDNAVRGEIAAGVSTEGVTYGPTGESNRPRSIRTLVGGALILTQDGVEILGVDATGSLRLKLAASALAYVAAQLGVPSMAAAIAAMVNEVTTAALRIGPTGEPNRPRLISTLHGRTLVATEDGFELFGFETDGSARFKLSTPMLQRVSDAVLTDSDMFSSRDIVGFGDSLTAGAGALAGQSYLDWLAALTGRNVERRAYGGYIAKQIGAMAGTERILLTLSGNTIPASGGVAITGTNTPMLINGGSISTSYTMRGFLNGVEAIVSTDLSGNLTFTRLASGDPVAVAPNTRFVLSETGTAFMKGGFVEARKKTWIIGAGTNGTKNTEALRLSYRDMITRMIQSLTPRHPSYYVLEVPNSDAEPSGSSAYNDKMALNRINSDAFGPRFIGWVSYLIDFGLYDMGLTPTATDLVNISQRIIPETFRADPIHPNALGYEAKGRYIASQIR